MTTLHLRSLLAIAVTALLAACGGTDAQSNAPTQTAALVQSSAAQAAPLATSSAAAQAAAQAPQPDCAPEGCKSLRIIDGNAEAYRVEAMRRAADEANGALTS
jgi:pyruvate/2-oxoglutarate dehydrogenase complex dihydrolipoamide acyltransferase (E2) component